MGLHLSAHPLPRLYGVYIWLRGKSNIVYYPWAGNWMYLAQRYTGLIAFAYIIQHVIAAALHGRQPAGESLCAFHKVQMELAIHGCWPSTSSP